MLASHDTKIIVSALQLCDILMSHLAPVFSVYFQREGVIYQIDKLIEHNEAVAAAAAEKAATAAAAAAAATAVVSSAPASLNSTPADQHQQQQQQRKSTR